MQSHSQRRMYKVLSPVDKKNGTKYWMRVGSGFPGKDPASFNLYIDAWPNGSKMLHVREMDEDDFQKGRREGPSSEPDLPPAPSDDNDLPF